MKKLNRKKGFTIVELVIVIAVVGVLTAVLVPTFVNLANQAKRAENQTFVRNLNTQMGIREATEGKNETMYEAMMEAEDIGYNVEKLTPVDGNDVVWDSVANRFAIVKPAYATNPIKDNVVYSDGDIKAEKKTDLWKIYDRMPATQTYSIYAKEGWNVADANISNLTVGFDAGKNTGIATVSYIGTSSVPSIRESIEGRTAKMASSQGQEVVIRTNGGTLTINAEKDTVKHYKYADGLNVLAVAPSSYHEYGAVGIAQMGSGRFVAEEGSLINVMHIASNDAEIIVENNASVDVWTKESTVTTATVDDKGAAKDVSSIEAKAIANFENEVQTYAEKQVAKIGEKRFDSLQAAINAAEDGEEVELLKDLTQEDGILVDKNGVSFKFNLSSYTFKVTKGVNVSRRAIKVVGGTIEISNGVIDARNETAITSGTDNGTYGTVRIEPDEGKEGKAVLKDLTLYNNHHFGLSVKACTNGFVELYNCALYSDVGGGIEADGGTATIYDCTFMGTNGNLNTKYPWCASAISVSGTDYGKTGDSKCHLGVVNVYNSEFTATSQHALYVYSSGGTLNIYGGKFIGTNDVVRAETDTNSYPYGVAIVNIYNGEFDGTIVKDTKVANEINISGGSFTKDPTQFVISGKTVTESAGEYIVK